MISLYTESFPEQARHSSLKGFMGKFFSAISLAFLIVACVLLPSCGSSSPTRLSPEITPTGVSLTPGPNVSLDVGQGVAFSASPIADKFTFQSSNTAVVTVANNGQACAGTWNSLTFPQVCTPGNPGIAQVTASTLGVTSPPVTIYVHAPITSIAISKVAGQPQTLRTDCISKGTVHGPEKWLFQAAAFNGNTDITQSVGPFTWHNINPGIANIVTLSRPANAAQGCVLSPQGQCLNQQIATATTPGVGQIYASAGPFVGQPISVETCHVNSISIAAAPGTDPSITSFLVNSGTSTTLDATVTDIAGQDVTGVPLTWSTSNPVSVGASGSLTGSVFGSIGTANASGAGQGTVIASCTPPTCNAGIEPTLPIYPQAAFNFDVRSASSTAASPTVYATTTGCNTTNATCTPTLVSITRPSATASFAAGTPIALLSTPNSIVFDNTGNSAYLGVDSNDFNQKGLMILSGSSVTQVRSTPGKVLAISPDGNSAVISDTLDSPNLLFICTNCASSRTVTTLQISRATAAAFSPDSLKAYILAGNNVYIYSKLDPLQTITLSPGIVAEAVAFHPEGGFAYLAESSNSLTPYRTCDNAPISSATLNTSNTPLLIRPLPDGSTLLVLDPPNIDLVSVTSLTAAACTGTITNTTSSFDLGEGSFVPTQFFVSPDGSTAYILGNSSAGPPPSRLPFVMVFNVNTQSASALSLSNSATPLSASLSPDGKLLFVGADDGTLHVIDTTSGLDIQQVTFPFPTNELCFGPGNPATQVPLSQVTISAVSQTGSTGAYTYSVISGAALKVGQNITVSNMSLGGDNGTFTITSFGTDSAGNPTFLVTNSNGATATNQSGTGTVPISCNPDFVAVKP
jgi:hypothetical protein